MHRTQLYLSDELAAKLRRISRREHTTISQLVRSALEEKYLGPRRLSVWEALEACRGIWEDRKDLEPERFIRQLRKDTRLKSLTGKPA